MQVIPISDKSGYSQNPNKYFNFQRFSKIISNSVVLVEGGFEKVRQWEQFGLSEKKFESIQSKKVCVIEAEEPNKLFVGDDPREYNGQFHRVFTICPYTASWVNESCHSNNNIAVCWPFNEEYTPKKQKKIYDIVYTGHLVSGILMRDIQAMSTFNYRLVSNANHPLVTDRGVSYQDKMSIIAKSKITLVHNLLYPRKIHLPNIWRIRDWDKNKAFRLVPKWYQPWRWITEEILVPQQKSRVLEAAFGRSLILCKKDPFNVIERYFEPEKEFIYYESDSLSETIEEILKNYTKYKPVIEAAYHRANQEYTITAFVKKYLEKIS